MATENGVVFKISGRIGREVCLVEIACRLYQTSRLKFDEAARLANVDLDAFAAACASWKIPVYWSDPKILPRTSKH